MHLYNHFWKMLKANKSGLVIYGIIMLVMIVVIGVAAGRSFTKVGDDESFTKDVKISYADYDESELSKAIIAYLSVDNTMYDFGDKTEEEINDIVYFSVSEFHFYIPEGFEESVNNDGEMKVEYVTGAGESSYAYTVSNAINSYVNLYRNYMAIGYSSEEAIEKTTDIITKRPDISVYTTETSGDAAMGKEWCVYQIVLFLAYLTVGMIMLSAGVVILKSGKTNIRKRISAGPVSHESTTISDTLGLYTFGFVIWAIIMAGLYIFAGETSLMKERGLILGLALISVILCNCSITAFVTSFKLKSNSLSMIANIVGLSMSFMTGVFVPQWFLGESVLNFGKMLPFFWYVKALNIIYPECGAGYIYNQTEVLKSLGILLLFAVAFSLLSILVRKTRKA